MDEVLLITGAAGNMGRLLRPRLRRPGRRLRLLDTARLTLAGPDEELVTASITSSSAVAEACVGADAILHLAGLSNEAPWSDILAVNVDGTHNLLEGARLAGVGRVVLASSNHVAGFYTRDDAPVPATTRPRPDTYYGFSKAAVEALGSLYADRFGMCIACLRIGSCFPEPNGLRALSTWLSPDDAARLVEACLAAPPFGYAVVWGISANTRRWWTLDEGISIGYVPVDDAEKYAGRFGLVEPDLTDPVHHRLGGPFCDFPLGEWVR